MAIRPEVAIAAYLRSLDLSIDEVREAMPGGNPSQASISRWLSEAQSNRILRKTWRLDMPRDVLIGALHGLQNVQLQEDIAGRWDLASCTVLAARELRIVGRRRHKDSPATSEVAMREVRNLILSALGRAAAALFVSELAPKLAAPDGRQRVAAVAWGQTVGAFCDHLWFTRSDVASGHKLPDLLVVPAIGHVTETAAQQGRWRFSAQALARSLADAVGSDLDPLTVAVPARLPPLLDEEEDRLVREEILASDGGYRALFRGDEHEALAQQLDFAVLSIGPLHLAPWWPEHAWWQQLQRKSEENFGGKFHRDDYQRALGDEGVVGDILWHFMRVVGDRTEEATDPASSPIGKALNDSIVALEIEHLRTLANKARNQQAAGTLFIAESEAKGAICRAALDMGLVNHLVIDDALAEALVGPRARR